MTPELTAALVVFLAVAVWRLVRRRTPRRSGPLPDVPDASPMAVPIEAPGLDLPYSSLDPTAPTKRLANRTRVDGVPESKSAALIH
jgi:hypothetical protein